MKKLFLMLVGGCVLVGKLYGACTPDQPCFIACGPDQACHGLRVLSMVGVGNLEAKKQACENFCKMCMPCAEYLKPTVESCNVYEEDSKSQSLCMFCRSNAYKQYCIRPDFCVCKGEN